MKAPIDRQLDRMDVLIVRWRLGWPVKFWKLNRRLSRFWLVYWNSTPGATLEFRDRNIVMSPGKLVLIPPYTLVTAHTSQPFLHNFMEFEAASPFDSVKSVPMEFSAADYVPVLPPDCDQVHLSLALYSLVERLLLAVPREYFSSRNPGLFESRIQTAIQYMDAHPMKKYSAAELCRLVHLSESRFLHLFKEETGISARDYWMKLRLNLVLRMLEDTDLSIPEIAEEAGFSDRSQLSQVIKAEFGLTPAAIRKKHRRTE